jgi:hypothetical protein
MMSTRVPPSAATTSQVMIIAGEGRVVGDEVHLLDDADPGYDVDEASVDDVGIRRRLTGAA